MENYTEPQIPKMALVTGRFLLQSMLVLWSIELFVSLLHTLVAQMGANFTRYCAAICVALAVLVEQLYPDHIFSRYVIYFQVMFSTFLMVQTLAYMDADDYVRYSALQLTTCYYIAKVLVRPTQLGSLALALITLINAVYEFLPGSLGDNDDDDDDDDGDDYDNDDDDNDDDDNHKPHSG